MGVRSAEWGVRSAECGVWSVECREVGSAKMLNHEGLAIVLDLVSY